MCREQIGGSWNSLGGNSLGGDLSWLWVKAQALGVSQGGGREILCGEAPGMWGHIGWEQLEGDRLQRERCPSTLYRGTV